MKAQKLEVSFKVKIQNRSDLRFLFYFFQTLYIDAPV